MKNITTNLFCSKLETLISKSRIDEAVNILLVLSNENIKKDIILLSSRLSEYRNQEIAGISENNIIKNQIIYSLIDTISKIKEIYPNKLQIDDATFNELSMIKENNKFVGIIKENKKIALWSSGSVFSIILLFILGFQTIGFIVMFVALLGGVIIINNN